MHQCVVGKKKGMIRKQLKTPFFDSVLGQSLYCFSLPNCHWFSKCSFLAKPPFTENHTPPVGSVWLANAKALVVDTVPTLNLRLPVVQASPKNPRKYLRQWVKSHCPLSMDLDRQRAQELTVVSEKQSVQQHDNMMVLKCKAIDLGSL